MLGTTDCILVVGEILRPRVWKENAICYIKRSFDSSALHEHLLNAISGYVRLKLAFRQDNNTSLKQHEMKNAPTPRKYGFKLNYVHV